MSGSTTRPGSGSGSDNADSDAGPAAPAPAPAPTRACATALCRGGYEVASLPDVTLADLASFVPDAPSITGEPTGLGVVGMPTNLVAAASEQRLTGTLLGYAVTVRFVPVGFAFDYGDGGTRAATTGGASWSRLGQADFTPTPTSHVYAAPGTYSAHARVDYAASVDFGGGWRPVAGAVRATSAAYDVRIVEVRTALVQRTCLENPRGPGC
ncbi:hypothetical protein ABCS02_25640 [Microbacterium sp. X-17]|uniref:hypothetical protein n=1 Tax=Microbacterium sp. X-17 TaxID=3144404 RepID=UPI0031F4FC8D